MKLDLLIKETELHAVSGPTEWEVRGITVDSRQVRPGYVFVAIPGAQRDGWEYVEDALARGAWAVVSEREGKTRKRAGGNGEAGGANGSARPSQVTFVCVANARRAAAELASAFYGYPSERLQVAGVTGTNGKTTIAHMMRDGLRKAGREPGMLGTVTYEIGARAIPAGRTTPEACELQSMLAQMLSAGCRSAVMEVSSHSLMQDRTVGIDFDVAVFTNLTRDHLDYHETLENYFEAKSRLFRGLGHGRKKASAVVNVDDPWGRRLAVLPGLAADVLTYGMSQEAEVRAERIQLLAGGSSFAAATPWGRAEVRLRLLGRYNVSNALAAIGGCCRLGVSLDTAVAALAEMVSVPGRLEMIETGRGFPLFVDYAHTDDALQNVLGTLRELTAQRLIVVFGCGGNRDRTKRPIMGRVAARLADYAILTSDNPRKEDPAAILQEVRAGFEAAANFEIIEDRRQAIRRAIEMGKAGDVILIAGKGHETYQEFANTTIPFDDRQVAREILDGMAG